MVLIALSFSLGYKYDLGLIIDVPRYAGKHVLVLDNNFISYYTWARGLYGGSNPRPFFT